MSQPLFCWKKSVCSGLISLAGLGQLLHGLLPRYLITALTHQSHGHTAPFTFVRQAINSEPFAERTAFNRQPFHVPGTFFINRARSSVRSRKNLTKITKITHRRIQVHSSVFVNFRSIVPHLKAKVYQGRSFRDFHF
jgi:hypothetical protein